MKKALLALIALLVIGLAGAYAIVHLAFPKAAQPRAGKVDSSPARIERGKYLFDVIAGCADCHSVVDPTRFALPVVPGGYAKGKQFPPGGEGVQVAPNLTSDPATGAGRWSDGHLIRAIREGIGHDGRPLFPGMPYSEYAHMSDEDVESIVAYIRTIPPSVNSLPASRITFPMSIIMRLVPSPVAAVPPVSKADPAAYGAYLTKISGCQFCHTPFVKGQTIKEKLFAGGHEFETAPGIRAVSVNLTPEPKTGIGSMSEAQFLDKFYQYKEYAEKGSPAIRPELNTVMPWLGLARMDPAGHKAI
ncbi:MAG: cytochrome c [Bryobacterales bacterium]|nr:cytochrome c [Bryobacterales bacterium]